MNEPTKLVLRVLHHEKKELYRWLATASELREERDLEGFKAAFDVPADYGRKLSLVYVLAEMLEEYYVRIRPHYGEPFDSLLSMGFNLVDWMLVSRRIYAFTSRKATKGIT